MAKKKERKIFNIDEVNIEIDYEKLAEAIVQANEKQTQQYSVSREWMKFIIYPVFLGTAVVSGILSLCFGVHGVMTLTEAMNVNIFSLELYAKGFVSLMLCFFLISICLFTFFTGREIDKENDKQYVATMFSNVMALVALIVALIALVKG